jgi:kynureninase
MTSLADVEALDRADPLARFRAAFDLPVGVIYLDGNSLGPPTRAALARIAACADGEWKDGLIRSWNDAGWIELPRRAGAKIARLIGARPDEVIVADSVSVNLFKLAGALLGAGGAICVEADEFPTDQYVLEGLSRLTGAPFQRLAPGEAPAGGVFVKSLVHYKTAAVADMLAMEARARKSGTRIIWDLSHAAGLFPVDVAGAGARFAVGCGYKYLNGGPGAPSFVYVEGREAERLSQPIAGWMGAARPFDFCTDYHPAAGSARFAAGTPPILSLVALDAALDLFEGADLSLAQAKARLLSDIFIDRAAALGLAPTLGPGPRGGHVCFAHKEGYAVMQALIARGVIGDFRAPDLMRFGFSPLFLSYADVWRAADRLADVLRTEEWRRPEFNRRGAVT